MSDNNRLYRTLIEGTIVQQSALSVGGAAEDRDRPDVCYRDGLGRLTIPGTSLAGALVETAVRVFPQLIPADDKTAERLLGGRITAKGRTRPLGKAQTGREGERFLQSVWRFENAHPFGYDVVTEWRQGVGIRQATGATAKQKRALYDFEIVPVGTKWQFVLEIDTARGGPQAEALAVIALSEWADGRGWLGRSPARGTGWICLEDVQVLRLPLTKDIVELWPDNTRDRATVIQELRKAGAEAVGWQEACDAAWDVAKADGWQTSDWCYLVLQVELSPGVAEGGYGLDGLHIGGHIAAQLAEDDLCRLAPLSVSPQQRISDIWRGEYKRPDGPLVTTIPGGGSKSRPLAPGSSIRGPLRHAASRLMRGLGHSVRDPNRTDDPHAAALRQQAKQTARQDELRRAADAITALFGVEELSGRILFKDAALAGDYLAVRLEHHAEDEFAGGVYGTGKFDCDTLLAGQLHFAVVLEADSREELQRHALTLAGALELARFAHVPLGGRKWRGLGWLPWKIKTIQLHQAGRGLLANDAHVDKPIAQRLDAVFARGETTSQ